MEEKNPYLKNSIYVRGKIPLFDEGENLDLRVEAIIERKGFDSMIEMNNHIIFLQINTFIREFIKFVGSSTFITGQRIREEELRTAARKLARSLQVVIF